MHGAALHRIGEAPDKRAARCAGLPFAIVLGFAALAGCATDRASKPLYADLTDSDVTLAATTINAALEHASHGQTRTWHNPETAHAGVVTPQRTYLSKAGFYCRDYQETLTVDGRSETYSNTACRDADGLWRWVD